MSSTREYEHKTIYNHPQSQRQRSEGKIKTQNSVETLRARHNSAKAEQGRRHKAESQQLNRKHDNEIAHDVSHHGGRGRGDREREKERRALADRHQRERDDLDVQQDKEMTAAKATAARDLE
jgi:hypothetical protein